MAVTHPPVAGPDDPTKQVSKTVYEQDHLVADGSFVAAKLSATATGVIFGRATAGAGSGEEIACTASGRALIDDASAAAQATTLGLGTGDSPQFTAVNVGHASDTTVTRASAGDIAVEGNAVYRAGGTDVPIADGGTGASDAATARTNLGIVYALQSTSGSANPVDGQTVYQGMTGVAPQTTESIYAVPIPIAGTLIALYLEIGVGGTLGTTEQATVSLRLNATTDVQITAAAQFNAARQQYSATGLSTALAAGDRFQIKCINPTWVTNPTGVVLSAVALIRP